MDMDPDRIGALDIYASGRYVRFAARTDRRIKVIANINAADTGQLFREGLLDTPATLSRDIAIVGLEKARKEHTAEAKGEKPHLDHIVPNTMQEIPDIIPTLYEGTDYCRTPRAQNPSSVNWHITRSLDMLETYSSYAFLDLISPPLLMVAGSEADTPYFSKYAIEKSKELKELFVVEGKSHIDLYDHTEGVMPTLTEFLQKYLVA